MVPLASDDMHKGDVGISGEIGHQTELVLYICLLMTQNVFLKQLLIFGLSDTKNKYIKHETVFLHFPKLHIGTHAKIIAIHIIQYR